jgi:hypothetical protein
MLLDAATNLDNNLERLGRADRARELAEANLAGGKKLKTAGAYKKRAAAAAAEDRFEDAAADYLRALLRPGVDPQAATAMETLLASSMAELKEWRVTAAKEAAEFAAQEARALAERQAIEATARAKEEDEADWARWTASEMVLLDGLGDGGDFEGGGEEPSSPFLTMSLTRGGNEPVLIWAALRPDEDAFAAATRVCRANGLASARDALSLAEKLAALDGAVPVAGGDEASAAALLAEGSFASAAADYARLSSRAAAAESASEAPRLEHLATEALGAAVKLDQAFRLFAARDWEGALSSLSPLVSITGPHATRLGLMRTRSFGALGKHAESARSAGVWLQWAASAAGIRGRWERGTPRMLLAWAGASAALEMGDVEKAKKYQQMVLRADPDQAEVQHQYNSLKKLLALLKQADSQLDKGYNHKALVVLDDALASMRGLAMASGTFRSRILLRLCNANR